MGSNSNLVPLIGMLFRWMIFVARLTFSMCMAAIVSLYRGLPVACNITANDWTERAFEMGAPTLWGVRIYRAAWILAAINILISWLLLSFLTMMFCRLIT